MANEREAQVLDAVRQEATVLARAVVEMIALRDRFNALGGTPGFQGIGGSGKLFAPEGQLIPYADFLGVFNAIGALEADTEWPALLAQLARTRAL